MVPYVIVTWYCRWWLKQSIASLSAQLSALGSRLIIRRGTACVEVLLQLLCETGASAVFFNHLFDPISLVRDHDMKMQLTTAGSEEKK
jgi:deoxyribodipyrimidine photolyase